MTPPGHLVFPPKPPEDRVWWSNLERDGRSPPQLAPLAPLLQEIASNREAAEAAAAAAAQLANAHGGDAAARHTAPFAAFFSPERGAGEAGDRDTAVAPQRQTSPPSAVALRPNGGVILATAPGQRQILRMPPPVPRFSPGGGGGGGSSILDTTTTAHLQQDRIQDHHSAHL